MKRSASLVVAVAAFAGLPWVIPLTALGALNLGATYAMVAISIVILTGWVGQISLGHAALVGIGAYTTGWIADGMGLPFPANIVFASITAGASAILLGTVALRVRGLYLAVATLVFSWMASEFLFRQELFTRHDQIPARVIGGDASLPAFDLTDRRIFFLLAWALVIAAAYGALNLRDSRVGRAFYAVRGSEMAAASLGIDVMRTKLLAFAISGVLAGGAGNLMMTNARVASADSFTFGASLLFLAIAVVGGLRSVGGAVASSLVFAALTELFFQVPALGGFLEVISAILLAVVLLAYRGGLASAPSSARAFLRAIRRGIRSVTIQSNLAKRMRGLPRRLDASPIERVARTICSSVGSARASHPEGHLGELVPAIPNAHVSPNTTNGHGTIGSLTHESRDDIPRHERVPLIETERVTVQFGGLTAVNEASLSVREGEIVGLIGPNGAGKTTLFNAIAGFNSPTTGTIRLYSQDVSGMPVHRRAAVGVARTFQSIQLFGSLTVFENLLVATHVHNRSSLVSNLMGTERAMQEEQRARSRTSEVLRLLELEDVADRRVADLPFGILRMVELARAFVTDFRVIMLDEPASGLDNKETDRLIDVLRFVRGLGVTLLLIEHDVRMVTKTCDYIYVLDQGTVISEGSPAAIQGDSSVIAAYLGEPATKELV